MTDLMALKRDRYKAALAEMDRRCERARLAAASTSDPVERTNAIRDSLEASLDCRGRRS